MRDESRQPEEMVPATAEAAKDVWTATCRDREPAPVALVTFADGAAWLWVGGPYVACG